MRQSRFFLQVETTLFMRHRSRLLPPRRSNLDDMPAIVAHAIAAVGIPAYWPGFVFVTSEPATQDRARRSLSLVLHRSPAPATATHGLALLPLTPAADSSGAPARSPPRQAWCQDKPVTGLASLPRRVRSAAELFCFPLGGPPAASERPARRKTFWTVGIVVKRGSVAMRRAQHGRKRQ